MTTRSGATHGTGLEEARARLASARRVVALTGAGISAESGVPTFRGPSAVGEAFPQPRERDSLALERLDGLTTRSRSHQVDALWRQFRPEDLATPRAFARDPGLVWEWYAWRRERIAAVRPNAGHHALARLEQRTPESAQAARAADVVLVVGTSSLVYPAAALPQAGLAAGAFVVEVNPERTPLSESCPVSLRGRAAEVLPQLVGEAA